MTNENSHICKCYVRTVRGAQTPIMDDRRNFERGRNHLHRKEDYISRTKIANVLFFDFLAFRASVTAIYNVSFEGASKNIRRHYDI